MCVGLLTRKRIGKHNILLLSFVLFSWLCLVQYGSCTKKCYHSFDCKKKWDLKDHCCVYVNENVGVCKPNKGKKESCRFNIKYVMLANGGIAQNECTCGYNLACTQIERKNWEQKLEKWTTKKIRSLTRYKYKCKDYMNVPEEIQEWRGK